MSRQLRNLQTKNLKKKEGGRGFNVREIGTVLVALRAGITPVEDKNKKVNL